ncbi:uncharacterized protein SETTUDRAFT_164586 [Exserohilum turcica Et28A]|uniref:Secreted protein n=1 Tax=Exserohilum turcicum (strain 28A) TaxID=671987 RepID=R0K474_EXST2|nr:uncharacterized protein SETTUDRAFT_164586 [Exserohilum turcica Et28A]EOA83122.1 hypothetical protein SETTUDRAFT_164586 [Exserohilum turcica Et28A]
MPRVLGCYLPECLGLLLSALVSHLLHVSSMASNVSLPPPPGLNPVPATKPPPAWPEQLPCWLQRKLPDQNEQYPPKRPSICLPTVSSLIGQVRLGPASTWESSLAPWLRG